MDRKRMLELLKEGIDPLEISIMKWEDIVNRRGYDKRSDNCALCEVYFNACENMMEVSCPIGSCESTPYIDWIAHHYEMHGKLDLRIRCTTCRELALKELRFLDSLRMWKHEK